MSVICSEDAATIGELDRSNLFGLKMNVSKGN